MTASEVQTKPSLEIIASSQFAKWLFEQKISVAFSTYTTNKIFLVGVNQQGKLSVFERTFERPTALYSVGNRSLYLATSYQIWRFENALSPGEMSKGYDGIMVPQVAWTTGALDVSDIGVLGNGNCIFANTRFSCVCRVSDVYSFEPYWKPYFITQLAPENRCHLSGVGIYEGRLKYVTAYAATDTLEGWTTQCANGGVLIDAESNTPMNTSLYMPNNPVEYNKNLYILNSGTGELGTIDLKTGQFTSICACPGFARGLAIKNDYAIVGLSKFREAKNRVILPVEKKLEKQQGDILPGVAIVNLKSGEIEHTFGLQGFVNEVFDVTYLDGIFCPSAIGLLTDEIRHTVTIGNSN